MELAFLKDSYIFDAVGREIITADNIENVYLVSVKIHKLDDDIIIIPA